MKIRHKLTLLFTVLTATLLTAFALVIYLNYADTREEEFFRRLRQQAVTKANLLFDAGVDPEILQLIYQKSREATFQEEVAIYDPAFNLIYHDAVEIDFVKESPGMIDQIRREGEIQFIQNKWQVVGFLYAYQNQEYVVTAAAYDQYGHAQTDKLKYSLVVALVVSAFLLYWIGRFYARQALNPVTRMVDQVEEITATSLDRRVSEGNGRDEIAELAVTFNRMLKRLENSFEAQKIFVSNISHELRTPLASIMGELELARSQERTSRAYEEAIDLALQDARKMSRLSTGLLDLAKASYDPSGIKFKETRVDEILLDARQELLKSFPAYAVTIQFEQPDGEEVETIHQGNEYLLKVAFLNLLENACKFSANQRCSVSIASAPGLINVAFTDQGIGIPPEEVDKIFTPFFRGTNRAFSEGYGIGLPLTHKIIGLHRGKIRVTSEVGKGTTFTVSLPRL
jgi:signal transduction histidine kinase